MTGDPTLQMIDDLIEELEALLEKFKQRRAEHEEGTDAPE